MKKTTSGFTIVELLIVIVVIAILAAITIIAFNGIQTRAENTKTTQAVAQYIKIIHSYAATYGVYPIESGYPCLSEAGTTCGKTGGGTTCYAIGLTGPNTAYITELKKIATTLPKTSSQQIKCLDSTFSGAWVYPSTGKDTTIAYLLKGDQPCAGIGGVQSYTKRQYDDLTYCTAVLPTL